jgi:hypothetical protein
MMEVMPYDDSKKIYVSESYTLIEEHKEASMAFNEKGKTSGWRSSLFFL